MLATKSVIRNIDGPFQVEYLLLGGGGGGGGNYGGGGAGGYRLGATGSTSGASSGTHQNTTGTRESPMRIAPDTDYNITLGAGGANGNPGVDGTDTSFVSISGTAVNITAKGGGGGRWANAGSNTTNIGSGGGGSSTGGFTAGIVTVNTTQGFNGGSYGSGIGGGGGGAGEAGNTDGQGHGGDGLFSDISGTNVQRGGGGGGAKNGTVSPGGAGGGAPNDTDNSGSPYANLGGGGGGGYTFSAFPGREGVIVLKIPDTHTASFPDGGVTSATITSVSGFNIYNITAITGTKKIRFTRT